MMFVFFRIFLEPCQFVTNNHFWTVCNFVYFFKNLEINERFLLVNFLLNPRVKYHFFHGIFREKNKIFKTKNNKGTIKNKK